MELEQSQALRFAAEASYPGLRAALESYAANLPPAAKAPSAAAEPQATPASEDEAVTRAVAAATAATAKPKPVGTTHALSSGLRYVPIQDFSWDQGGYNAATVGEHFTFEVLFLFDFYNFRSLCM